MSQRSGRGVKPVGTKSQVYPKKLLDGSPKMSHMLRSWRQERWSDGENTIYTNVPTAVNCFENKQTLSLNLEIDHVDPSTENLFQKKIKIITKS